MNIATGSRITVRGEDFIVNEAKEYVVKEEKKAWLIEAEGISALVKGKHYSFDTALDECIPLHPADTQLVADRGSGYQRTKLFLECQLRNATTTSDKITVAQYAAFNHAAYQWTPTLLSLIHI